MEDIDLFLAYDAITPSVKSLQVLRAEVSRLRSQEAELKQALEIDGDAAAHFLATISGLRSQVERMRVEAEDWKASHGHAAKLLMRYREDLLTPEEARAIIEYLDMGGRVERSERAHTVAKSADAKLRRRLSSDSETGDTNQ